MSVSSLQQPFTSVHHALHNDSYGSALRDCDEIIQLLHSLELSLASGESSLYSQQLKSLASLLTQAKSQHTKSFKSLYNETQKMGKQMDRVLNSCSVNPSLLPNTHFDLNAVDELIIENLCRDGRFEVANTYINESGCQYEIDAKLQEMHQILAALEARDVLPCLYWAIQEEQQRQTEVKRLLQDKKKSEDLLEAEKISSEASKVTSMSDLDDEEELSAMTASPSPSHRHIHSHRHTHSHRDRDRDRDRDMGTPHTTTSAEIFAHFSAVLSGAPPPVPSSSIQSNNNSNSNSNTTTSDTEALVASLNAQLNEQQKLAEDLRTLQFDLHRIRFLQLLTASVPPSSSNTANHTTATPSSSPASSHQLALSYAKTYFSSFVGSRMEEIQKLSGLLLFYPDLTASPYAHIVTPPTSPVAQSIDEEQTQSSNMNTETATSTPSGIKMLLSAASSLFSTTWHRLHHMPDQSPLLVALAASDVAYPQLLHYQQVVAQSTQILSASSSLSLSSHLPPLEFDLGSSFPYHSIFICPVTKEQCHVGNDPVMLKCGHLISTSAMDKIVKGLRMTRRFKCPTCPKEQTPAETITIRL